MFFDYVLRDKIWPTAFSDASIVKILNNNFRPGVPVKHRLFLFFLLITFLFCTSAFSADVTIAWNPNTEADLLGYQLSYGTSSAQYDHTIDVGNVTQYTIVDLQAGKTYYFAAKAYDTEGLISDFSDELAVTVPAPLPVTHVITATAGINGQISPVGNVTVEEGASQAFTIIPDTGYFVLDVLVDGASVGATSQYDFTNVTESHTISASFAKKNQPPLADAGPDQTVSEGQLVTLNAGNASDPEGNIASYFWEQTGGPTVQLSDPNAMVATFTAPYLNSVEALLDFRLTVTDNEGLQASDACRITVTEDAVPDEDGDGVPDSEDAFPSNPNEWLDTDGDGLGNNADGDDDEDGLPDAWELLYGLDPLIDDALEDPDGDGIVNYDEYASEMDPTVFDSNLPPDKPEISSPVSGSMVGLSPALEASPFYDANTEDDHTATQWQIFVEENDSCVLDIRSAISLTTLTVPPLILSETTNYYCKVRYYDTAGTPSKWSEPAPFTTDGNFADGDGNGVPDLQEPEESLDLDGNGTEDSDQEEMKIVKSEIGNVHIGISVNESETASELISVQAEDPGAYLAVSSSAAPAPEEIPFGLIQFKAVLEQPGEEAVVTIYLSEAAPEGSAWYKFDPIEGAWYDYSAHSTFSADRKSIRVVVKDGGHGDLDGLVNGIIVDPSGIGVNPAANISGTGSSGGGGGCFTNAAGSVPWVPWTRPSNRMWRWALASGIAALFIALSALSRRRETRF